MDQDAIELSVVEGYRPLTLGQLASPAAEPVGDLRQVPPCSCGLTDSGSDLEGEFPQLPNRQGIELSSRPTLERLQLAVLRYRQLGKDAVPFPGSDAPGSGSVRTDRRDMPGCNPTGGRTTRSTTARHAEVIPHMRGRRARSRAALEGLAKLASPVVVRDCGCG